MKAFLAVLSAALLLSVVAGRVTLQYGTGGTTGGAQTITIDPWVPGQNFAERSATVGSTITFVWPNGVHGVYKVPAGECPSEFTDGQNGQDSIAEGRPGPSSATYTFNAPGVQWFACPVDGHCEQGMLIKGPAAPSSSPTRQAYSGRAFVASAPSLNSPNQLGEMQHEQDGFLVPVVVKRCEDAPEKGAGVFAAEDAPADTLLWRPSAVTKLSADAAASALAHLPLPAAKTFLRQAFVSPEDLDSLCINPDDLGRFVNHSVAPNCSAGVTGGVALREVRAGDELTCDYRGLGCPAWYQSLCTQYGVLSTDDVVHAAAAQGNSNE